MDCSLCLIMFPLLTPNYVQLLFLSKQYLGFHIQILCFSGVSEPAYDKPSGGATFPVDLQPCPSTTQQQAVGSHAFQRSLSTSHYLRRWVIILIHSWNEKGCAFFKFILLN